MHARDELDRILKVGVFTEARLLEARARAVDAERVPDEDQTTIRRATGYALSWKSSPSGGPGNFELGIDGTRFYIGHALHEVLRNRAPYHVYFARDRTGHALIAIEPARPEAVPDAVAQAAQAAGFSREDPRAAEDGRVLDRLRREIQASFERVADFTAEDLAEHAQGRMTPGATRKLRNRRTTAVIVGSFVLAFVAVFAAIESHLSTLHYVGLGLGTLIGLWFLKKGIEHTLNIAHGRVEAALAVVSSDANSTWPLVSLRLENGEVVLVHRLAFSIRGFHPDVLDALTYRVFRVLGTSQEPVSLEPGPDLSPLFRSR